MVAPPAVLTEPSAAAALGEEISVAGRFALDTEFISERSYRPELALVQVATPTRLALIDPLAVPDLHRFWSLVADPVVETVVHAGEQEARFCWFAVGALPGALRDVQLAAAFAGEPYPLTYGSLVQRILGVVPAQGQARTDWLRRPLTGAQLVYAEEDVRHLLPLWERLAARLAALGREDWFQEESERRLTALRTELTTSRWWRVAGSQRLNRRGRAVVRELAEWREGVAERRNRPRQQVAPDHLLVALAETRPRDRAEARRVRGCERLNDADLEALVKGITRALALPEAELPEHARRPQEPPQARMLATLLQAVLESLCAEQEIAATVVGGADNLRELVLWHLDGRDSSMPPALLQGWRAAFCGDRLEAALYGKIAVRVRDPHARHPLELSPPPPEAERERWLPG